MFPRPMPCPVPPPPSPMPLRPSPPLPNESPISVPHNAPASTPASMSARRRAFAVASASTSDLKYASMSSFEVNAARSFRGAAFPPSLAALAALAAEASSAASAVVSTGGSLRQASISDAMATEPRPKIERRAAARGECEKDEPGITVMETCPLSKFPSTSPRGSSLRGTRLQSDATLSRRGPPRSLRRATFAARRTRGCSRR